MKRIVTRTVEYQCETCGTKHQNAKEAKKCEAMPTEEKLFRVGDIVDAREERDCQSHRRHYRVRGARVITITRAQRFDAEYENKWLGGRGVGTHVYQYEVEFTRPCCRDKRTHLYYAPELKRVREKT